MTQYIFDDVKLTLGGVELQVLPPTEEQKHQRMQPMRLSCEPYLITFECKDPAPLDYLAGVMTRLHHGPIRGGNKAFREGWRWEDKRIKARKRGR
jgi:hypothetical protein